MPDLLADEVAVVTGAARGIGRGIALACAEHGADVVVVDVREGPDDAAPTHELIADGTDAHAEFVDCDVTDLDELEAAVAAADGFGGVSVMVNNAGIVRPGDPLDTTPEEYDRTMAVNARGVFFGTQFAARRMVESGGGSVVNVSSINGILGNRRFTAYCASKGAVRLMTYAFADRLGPEGVRVNAVHPGVTETAMSEGMPESMREGYIDRIPSGRLGRPADVAGAVVYLASDLAEYVNGGSLVVDGGYASTG